MEYLVILLLLIVFVQTRIMDLKRSIYCLSLQALVIAIACLVVGFEHAEGFEAIIPSLMTLTIKVVCIPYIMLRLVGQITDETEIKSNINVNYSTAASALFLLLSYMIIDKVLPATAARDILAASIFVILTGLNLIVMRRRAIMQMVGLITMENGIYLLGLMMTEGLPLVIELGVFLDVLIAVVVLVILTSHLRLSFKTTDTNVLRKLKG